MKKKIGKKYIIKIIIVISALFLSFLLKVNVEYIFQEYNYYSYITMVSVFFLNFFFFFFLFNNSVPYFIRLIRKNEWKKIIAICCSSLMLTFSIISLRQWMVVQRSSTETIDLYQDSVIEQKLFFQNTRDLVLYCLIPQEAIDDECFITVTVMQDDYSEDITVNLDHYQSDFWDYIHLNTKNFGNGDAKLAIRGGNLQDNHVTFQLAVGSQHIDLGSVIVNGNIHNGKVLLLRYKYINIIAAIKILFTSVCLCIFTFSLYAYLKKYIVNNIAVVISFALIMIISIQNSIYYVPLNGWCATSWLLSYKYGFVSRGLPGSILLSLQKIITRSAYITENDLRAVFLILLVVLCLIILHWIGKMLRENKNVENGAYFNSVENITFFYILSPIFVTFYCYSNRLGRLDEILIICFVLCCHLIIKRRGLFLIPVLTAVAILTHQMFIFTLLPIILAVMLYCWLGEKDHRFAVSTVVTLCLDAILGFYCQFVANISGWTLQEVMADMQSKTNIPLLELMVSSEQFFDTQMFTDYYMDNYVDFAVVFKYFWFVLLCLPLYYVYIQIWKNSIQLVDGKKKKFWMFIISVSPICVLPIFFTAAVDFGRWTVEYGTAAFFGIFMMVRMKNQQVLLSIKAIDDKLSDKVGKGWPFYCGIIFVVLGRLDDAQGFGIEAQIKQFVEVFMKMIEY